MYNVTSKHESRIFINHLNAGTVPVYKSIPLENSSRKRYRLILRFVQSIGLYPSTRCARCGISLHNPQSMLMHVGAVCRSKRVLENNPSQK